MSTLLSFFAKVTSIVFVIYFFLATAPQSFACPTTNVATRTVQSCSPACGGAAPGKYEGDIRYTYTNGAATCNQIEYFSNSGCTTPTSNACPASCSSDAECGQGVCANGNQSPQYLCTSGEEGPQPWWCQGYNCGYVCTAPNNICRLNSPGMGYTGATQASCEANCQPFPTLTPTPTIPNSTPVPTLPPAPCPATGQSCSGLNNQCTNTPADRQWCYGGQYCIDCGAPSNPTPCSTRLDCSAFYVQRPDGTRATGRSLRSGQTPNTLTINEGDTVIVGGNIWPGGGIYENKIFNFVNTQTGNTQSCSERWTSPGGDLRNPPDRVWWCDYGVQREGWELNGVGGGNAQGNCSDASGTDMFNFENIGGADRVCKCPADGLTATYDGGSSPVTGAIACSTSVRDWSTKRTYNNKGTYTIQSSAQVSCNHVNNYSDPCQVTIRVLAPFVTIGGNIKNSDTNANISNVQVRVRKLSNGQTQTNLTDTNGNFRVTNFIREDENYNVEVVGNQVTPQTAPSGYATPAKTSTVGWTYDTSTRLNTDVGALSYQNQQANNNDCAGPNGSGTRNRCNFTYSPAYTISGGVFIDSDGDNIKDAGESYYTGSINITSPLGTTTTSNGTYTISRLAAGDHNVQYNNPPTGYNVFPSGTPSLYRVTVGPGCITDGEVQCVGGNVTNLNFALNNSTPWFQTYGLNVRFDDGVNIPVSSGSLCGGGNYALAASNTLAGIFFTGDSTSTFSPGSISARNWTVGGGTYPSIFTPSHASGSTRVSYDYAKAAMQKAGISLINMNDSLISPTICSGGGLSNCTLPANLQNGVYEVTTGNLTLNSYTFPANKNYIFFVQNNLTLRGEIHVPTSSTVTFFVNNNIYVDSSVGFPVGSPACPTDTNGHIEGFFSADNSFIVQGSNNCSTGADRMLNVQGAIVVNADNDSFNVGTFQNGRSLCDDNASYPTITVKERLDFILHAPEAIKFEARSTQEVNP